MQLFPCFSVKCLELPFPERFLFLVFVSKNPDWVPILIALMHTEIWLMGLMEQMMLVALPQTLSPPISNLRYPGVGDVLGEL